ncbi:fluoride efflux transporter CrcB [soil metagenome]
MKSLVLIFLGGGLGSIFRYLAYKGTLSLNLPLYTGTFIVNILGSLVLGIVLGYSIKQGNWSENSLLFLATGICGGFTTFSTFALENQEFLRNGDYLYFAMYSLGSIFLGILAIFLGLLLSKLI